MKTAEFGRPCRAPEPGRCRICGCTEDRACNRMADDPQPGWHQPCGWADHTQTLCDNPACLAAARSELTVKPEEAEALQRPFTGERYGFAPQPEALLDAPALGLNIDGYKRVLEHLQMKIEAAVLDAHGRGLDFVHGPIEFDCPGSNPCHAFEPFDITRPVKITAVVKGGPVSPGMEWPHDWTVYRCQIVELIPTDDLRSFSRGFYAALDHIAGFINSLDSGDMSGKQVRTAIYSECLTAKPNTRANTTPTGEETR